MTTTDRVGTINAFVELTDAQAEQLLRRYLRLLEPDLAGVNEWDGPKPDLDALRSHEHDVDDMLERSLDGTRYRFRRPAGGGNPVIWNGEKRRLLSIGRVQLAGAQDVGRLPGRKTHLPASTATVAIFENLVLGGREALDVMHLTAEVQKGAGYRTDKAHAPRVNRHKHERAELEELVLRQQRAGLLTRVVGDTNFDGMKLPPLVSCWEGHSRAEAKGTLAHRTVDQVYGPGRASDVETLETLSDHDAVVATYPRKENR